MNSLWRIVRPLMAAIGGALIFGAVGRSDYYILELGQQEPKSVVPTIVIGILLMVPTVIHLINKELKGNDYGC